MEPVPVDVTFVVRITAVVDVIHGLFHLAFRLGEIPWSYPAQNASRRRRLDFLAQKASGIRTDVTDNVIRENALPVGLVDIKVCTIDETWSGLKLVRRVNLR